MAESYGLFPVLAGLLLLGLLIRPLTNRLHIPFEAMLLVLGLLYGNLIENPGARALSNETLRDIVFNVFLPLLIFATAFQLDARRLGRNLVGVLTLALPMATISILLTAWFVYQGINHPSGFPWIAAFLTAAVLGATDSHALREMLPVTSTNRDIRTLVVSEDLLSGAASIVLFTMLLFVATNPDFNLSGGEVALAVGWNVIGGGLIGLAIGLCALVILRIFEPTPGEVFLYTLLAAFLSYRAAEYAGMSGVLAVLVTALIAGRTLHEDLDTHASPHEGLNMVDQFWKFFERLAASLLFLLIGLNIHLEALADRWLAILISIAAVLLARAIGLLVSRPILSRYHHHILPAKDANILYFTGTRGAITVGLAMSLPDTLPYAWTIEAIGLGVVLFTLIAQAPFVEYWINRYALQESGEEKGTQDSPD